MSSANPVTPRVFISYSHDSRDHKRWVLQFAEKLVEKGIDVSLDQWDIGPGHDIIKYMEQSVVDADYVLLICTSAYVAKANDGKGGVGYESTIVSGQLMRDLGTSKFIPIIRQTPGIFEVPTSLSTRFFVDMNDDSNLDEAWDQLLREIHKQPASVKPKLGSNPFAVSPAGNEIKSESRPIRNASEDSVALGNLAKEARDAVLSEDILAWRKLVTRARAMCYLQLTEWRTKYDGIMPRDQNELASQSIEGIKAYTDLFLLAATAISSGKQSFSNQSGLLHDIVSPDDWNRSGYVVVVDLPKAAGYVFQALAGATALHVGRAQPFLAIVEKHVRINGENLPLWQHSDIIGWPESLGRNSAEAWQILMNLPDAFPWLSEIFANQEGWQIALTAYYMALNVLEFSHKTKGNSLESNVYANIPLSFATVRPPIARRALDLLMERPENIELILKASALTLTEARQSWGSWMNICKKWLHSENRFSLAGMPHESIFA